MGGGRLLNIVETFSNLLAENSNSTNDSRTIERENISKSCILIHYPATFILIVINVRLVELSENADIVFPDEVTSTDVNFTKSSILIPYAIITERAALLQMGTYKCISVSLCEYVYIYDIIYYIPHIYTYYILLSFPIHL